MAHVRQRLGQQLLAPRSTRQLGTRGLQTHHTGGANNTLTMAQRGDAASRWRGGLAATAGAAVLAVAVGGTALVQTEASPTAVVASAASSSKSPDGEADIRPDFEAMVLRVQQEICDAISELDGHKFRVDEWERPNGRGIGKSCVLQDGNVFDKAGVNVSVVKGELPEAAVKQMRARGKAMGAGPKQFYAAGISLVIHPHNPMAPTVHLNYRTFEVTDPETGEKTWWHGGGADLTPSYLFEEDAVEFHSALRKACDKHDPSYYARFKKWCDEYFYITHRKESRGIGGIFFDDLEERPASAAKGLSDREAIMAFQRDCLESFVPTYVKIVKRRKDMAFTEAQKEWQQLRRGRYVEFNLVLDRGTKFGLATPDNARIESILVSLPLTARWEYMHEPEEGSPEAKLVDVLKNPRDWDVDLAQLGGASFQDIVNELARRTKRAETELASKQSNANSK